jgi:hypothetical protein
MRRTAGVRMTEVRGSGSCSDEAFEAVLLTVAVSTARTGF